MNPGSEYSESKKDGLWVIINCKFGKETLRGDQRFKSESVCKNQTESEKCRGHGQNRFRSFFVSSKPKVCNEMKWG